MKTNGMFWLALTTSILIIVTIFAAMNLIFSTVFYLTIVGQVLLVFSVVKVLKDDYKTDKTFEDFYEDRSDLGRN
ncbi:MAG: hypothetical protein ED556_07370 [Winogradskyella sp.]|uniref:hypothetical protein n=1 Tax=Winogradskyella sp. TaxID=1883156 RepID=UPI000F3BCED1|nr:hypothetical protein [Winogradskyella sp.]RNC87231.1 MAG: hypothetical protein ED556_07370 [Winogradskyella sp.]